MKVGNKSINGLLSFVIGLEYEYKDIILTDGNLYIVTNEEGFVANDLNQVTDGSLGFCTPYFEYLSYKIDQPSSNPNGPIDIVTFRSLLNQVIAGIDDVGIQDLELRTDAELDGLDTTAIYRIKFTETTSDFFKPNQYYLYRCYYINEYSIYQEIIDFEYGDITLRIFNGYEWISNNLLNGNYHSDLVQELKNIQSKLSKYKNWIDTILATGYTWFNLTVGDPYHNEYQALDRVTLINVILVKFIDQGFHETTSKLISLNYYGTTTVHDSNYVIKIDNSSNLLVIDVESSEWEISAILANKPLK